MGTVGSNSSPSLPLISCLCVTRNRVALLQRAVGCFQRQTYPERELLILSESDDAATRTYVETQRRDDPRIRFLSVDVEEKLPLGALRNRAIAEARGELVCQWDDDDWYRHDRLQRQQAALDAAGKQACVLERWTVFDCTHLQSYLSFRRTWEGSLLAYKSVVAPYPTLARGEDTPVIDDLKRKKRLVLLDAPEIYVYTFHGRNTWDDRHFDGLLTHRARLSEAANRQIIRDLGYPEGSQATVRRQPFHWLNPLRFLRRSA